MILPVVLALSLVPAHALGSEPVTVIVSIAPQQYLVEGIGGGRVRVNAMVQPGYSPEVYEPTPRQMAALGEARLYFRICVPFEYAWMGAIAAASPGLEIIDCSMAIRYRSMNGSELPPGTRPGPGIHDPHVWTSPENARILALEIRDALARVDPASASYYEENYRVLADELAQLDTQIASTLEASAHTVFIVSHDSWGYYAARYGLRQIALETGGRERGPRGLADLVEQARREHIGTLFTQRQHQGAASAALARELGAKQVELDPLSGDYVENLRTVTRLIAETAVR